MAVDIDQMSIAAGIITRIKNLKEVLCRMRVVHNRGLGLVIKHKDYAK